MKRLSDIAIGEKLAIAFGGSIGLAACMMGVALWAIHSISATMKEAQRVGHATMLAEKVPAKVGAIAQRVATMVLAGEADPEIMAQLLALRRDYIAAFAELKSMTVSEEGGRLLGQAEAAATRWRQADNRVIALLKTRKASEAAVVHRQQVVPSFNQLGTIMVAYVDYGEKTLASINAENQVVISRFTAVLVGAGLVTLAVP